MPQTAPIYIITGTPGSGKSSVAVALMRRFPFGLHIPVDDLRELVVSGIAHPVPAWTAETGRQFRLARQSAALAARLYADAGFAVAIDDVISIDDAQALLAEPLSDYAVRAFLIRPSLEIALERNALRTNKQFDTAVLRQTIASLYRTMDPRAYSAAGWHVLDSSRLSLDETVDRILAASEP